MFFLLFYKNSAGTKVQTEYIRTEGKILVLFLDIKR